MEWYYNILKIFKSAAEDIPSFYPEWVKNYPDFKSIKSLSDIVKNIPIENYREKIQLNIDVLKVPYSIKRNVLNNLLENINRLFLNFLTENENNISENISENIKDNIYDFARFIFKQVSVNNTHFFDKLLISDKLSDILALKGNFILKYEENVKGKNFIKTINVPNNTSLITACRMFINFCERLTKSNIDSPLKNISSLPEFNKLTYLLNTKNNKNDSNYEIVFSKNPKDLLSMSIRSDWTSCQNLLRKEDENNVKAIFSAISPYVGIIYITNNKNYQERGEQMIARAIVFYLENEDGTQSAIKIDNIYSNYNNADQFFLKIFKESLQKHSNLKIIDNTENFYFPSLFEDKNPYFNSPIKIKKINA